MSTPETCLIPEDNLEQFVTFVAEKKYGIAQSIQMHFIFNDCKKSCDAFTKIRRSWMYVKLCTFKIDFHKEAIAARISRIITALLFPGSPTSIPDFRAGERFPDESAYDFSDFYLM